MDENHSRAGSWDLVASEVIGCGGFEVILRLLRVVPNNGCPGEVSRV